MVFAEKVAVWGMLVTQAKAMADEFAALALGVLVELGLAAFGRP